MTRQRDQLVLGLAFVAAVALHALALPWVGQAVGRAQAPGVGSAMETLAAGTGMETLAAQTLGAETMAAFDVFRVEDVSCDRAISCAQGQGQGKAEENSGRKVE